ncbi:GGDEF domain-containing protein [Bacteriovoracaceae bacterium]|nr:GGDEF domain-containing protein [Bacteriovoracaceae bacterium]
MASEENKLSESELIEFLTSNDHDKNIKLQIEDLSSEILKKYFHLISRSNLNVKNFKISYFNLKRDKKININYLAKDLYSIQKFSKIFIPKNHENEIFYCDLNNYSDLSIHPFYSNIHYSNFEMIFQPVLSANNAGQIIYANNQALDMFSLTPKKVLRRKTNLSELIKVTQGQNLIEANKFSEVYLNNYVEIDYENLITSITSRMRIGIKKDDSFPQQAASINYIIYLYPVDIEEMLQEKYKTKKSEVKNLKIESEVKEEKIHNLKNKALTDSLTGLANKRAYTELCSNILKNKNFESLALVIIDFDRFKKINDTYGHPVGDICLKEFAKLAEHTKRPSDFVCRWGGEEFLFLLQNPKSGAGIKAFCERLRISTEENSTVALGEELKFTCSIGATLLFKENLRDQSTFEYALNKADKALYFCKRNGRNQSLVSSFYDEMNISQEYQNSLFFEEVNDNEEIKNLIFQIEDAYVSAPKNAIKLSPYYSLSVKSDEYIEKVLTFKPQLTCNFKDSESNQMGVKDLTNFLKGLPNEEFTISDSSLTLPEIESNMNDAFESFTYPTHVKEVFYLIKDELMSNATYNAPIDREGRPLYKNIERSKSLNFINQAKPFTISYMFREELIMLEVTDFYGSLQVEDIQKFMFDRKTPSKFKEKGGAGIGLHLLFQNSDQFFIKILKNKSTTFRCILYPKSKNKEFLNGFRSFAMLSD